MREKQYMKLKKKNNLITAVLTGKGGSKLKDKNVLNFFGKPLLSYPCKAAKKVKLIDNFFVSSENKKILQTANKYGYKKPIVYGFLSASFLSSIIGNDVPGPGSVWLDTNIQFASPTANKEAVDALAKEVEAQSVDAPVRASITQSSLNKMIEQHISLGASTTIPFASFCWFSNSDNKFLNQYHNSLEEVSNKFKENKLNLYCLEPPSDYIETKKLINKSKNPSTKLIEVESQAALESIKTSLIIKTIRKRISSLISFSNRFIFYLLERNIIFFIKDNSTYLNVDFRRIEIKEIDVTDQDNLSYMEINSQPLYFAFANSFGIQTLGVSGRYKFINYKKIPKVWKFIRIISSLDNNKTPLRFRTIFNQFFYKAIFSRRTSFMIQLKQQLSRFGNF